MVNFPIEVEEEDVKAAGTNLPISTKESVRLCKKLNKMKLLKAERLLRDMIDGKRSLGGKHYTKTCENILEILESAKNNANYKGINEERLRIKMITAEKGPNRRRLRRTGFGNKMKNTHIKVVLERG